MRTIELREMQRIELNLLLELDRVCRAHNIRYYIDGGTLLGAMCYEGFIPWDDDIDLKMPRPDYNRFLLLQDKFPKHITIDTPTEEHCFYAMTKLIDDRTVLEEDGAVTKKTGVYIDILPMDGHPDDPKLCEEHIKKMQRYNSLFHYALNNFAELKASRSVMTRMKGIVYSHLYSPWKLFKIMEKEAEKYPYAECHAVGLLVEGNPQKERFEKEWLQEGFKLEFEGHMFPAPCGYKRHLEIFYGDHVTKAECYHNLPQYPSNHKHLVYWKE